ncbi:hypothetical protein [Halosegnis marinus]|uniref:hypothetical protein n=1 Tax=Halosegnis marinus TaxID=3034023 RepID=UPI0036127D3B
MGVLRGNRRPRGRRRHERRRRGPADGVGARLAAPVRSRRGGEDPLAVARRIAGTLTGVEVEDADFERVTEFTREHATTGETTTSFDAVVRVAPVAGEPTAGNPDFEPWEDLVVGWFAEVPDEAYHEHGSAVSDVERFL